MNRKTLINLHLIAAAFFTPVLIIIAISGGLYMLGVKGEVTSTTIDIPANVRFDPDSKDIDSAVSSLLQQLGEAPNFEYVKVSGPTLFTRPTSRAHYEIHAVGDTLTVKYNVPSLQKRLIELHKGHGPLLFKDFQKAMAAALLFILLTGTWLGLSARGLRATTGASLAGGLVVFLALVLLT